MLSPARRRSVFSAQISIPEAVASGHCEKPADSLRGSRGDNPQMPAEAPAGCGILDADRHSAAAPWLCRALPRQIRHGIRVARSQCMRAAVAVQHTQPSADANNRQWRKAMPVQQVRVFYAFSCPRISVFLCNPAPWWALSGSNTDLRRVLPIETN